MQNDKIKVGQKARGDVNVFIYENDKLIEHWSIENLVLTLGKTNISKLLGGDVAGLAISKIGVGENGVGADVADNALTNSFTKALASVTYPDAQSVMFHFDIDNSEANGKTIREFGLLTSANVLCARKVRSADIIKTAAIRLVGTWKISIN